MIGTMLLKTLFLTKVKERVKEASKEEIYSNVVYLPLLFFVTATPTLLLILGLSLFVVIGVAQFYPQYLFPTDFILPLASLATIMSGVTFITYRLLLKKLLPKKVTSEVAMVSPVNIQEKLEGAFAPVLAQLKEEQSLFKNRIKK